MIPGKKLQMPGLGQQLSWLWLACGAGLALMGATTHWDDAAFSQPESQHLQVFTGSLQAVTFRAPAKSPTVVEVVIYHKRQGIKHGYLRYGYHAWEAQLKPYLHQDIALWLDKNAQIWRIETADAGHQTLLSAQTIEHRLQGMKQAQQAMAGRLFDVGMLMMVLWLARYMLSKRKLVYSS